MKKLLFLLPFLLSTLSLAQTDTWRAKLFISDSIKYQGINFVCRSTVAIQGDNLIISILEFPVFNKNSHGIERHAAIIELTITDTTYIDNITAYDCISPDGNINSLVWFIKKDSHNDEVIYFVLNPISGQQELQELQEFVRLYNVKKME